MIRKTGDWNKVRRNILSLPKSVPKIQREFLTQVGLKGQRIAVEKLSAKRNSDIKPPLSSEYQEQKKKQGYSNLTLVRTNTMRQAITLKVVKKDTVFFGVLRGVKHKNGEDLVNIAKIHEFGSPSRNIPARPLWKPTLEEVKKWVEKEKILEKIALKYIG